MLYLLTHGRRSVATSALLCAGFLSLSPAMATQSPEPTLIPPVNEVKIQKPIYEITPARRALLDTIRYAEGTWAGGSEVGYRIMFGGGTFKNLDRHPDQVNHGGGYSSAAAGAYQFMPATWGGVVSALRLNSFSPSNQDQGAIHLVKMRGALSAIDKGELSRQAVNLLAPEWASFPTTWGGSYYGQPSKTYGELDRFYRKRFIEYTSMPSSVAIEKTKETPVVLSSAPVSQVDPLKDFLKFLDLI